MRAFATFWQAELFSGSLNTGVAAGVVAFDFRKSMPFSDWKN